MARCDVCGNEYDKAFRVSQGAKIMTFASFECAIQAMAPQCAHCDCRVISHGVEAGGKIFCCAHCAKHEGIKSLTDRAIVRNAMVHKLTSGQYRHDSRKIDRRTARRRNLGTFPTRAKKHERAVRHFTRHG